LLSSRKKATKLGGNDIKDEDLEGFKVLRSKKNVKKVLQSCKTFTKPREEE